MGIELKEKTVLVSGASVGIGSVIAKVFVKEGANQVLTYLPDERGKLEIEDLKNSLKGNYLTVSTDLAKGVDNIFSEADKKFKRFDVLVACAGIWPNTKYIADKILDE